MNIETFAASNGGAGGGLLIFWVIIAILAIAGMWTTFQKAGKPGWAAIIPIYNAYVLLKVAGRPGWWVILYLIPLVNIIVSLVVSLDVAKAFGKDGAFGIIGLWIFSVIGYLILGFGDAKYQGASAGQNNGPGSVATPAASTTPAAPTPTSEQSAATPPTEPAQPAGPTDPTPPQTPAA